MNIQHREQIFIDAVGAVRIAVGAVGGQCIYSIV